jgi:hypothetical protein
MKTDAIPGFFEYFGFSRTSLFLWLIEPLKMKIIYSKSRSAKILTVQTWCQVNFGLRSRNRVSSLDDLSDILAAKNHNLLPTSVWYWPSVDVTLPTERREILWPCCHNTVLSEFSDQRDGAPSDLLSEKDGPVPIFLASQCLDLYVDFLSLSTERVINSNLLSSCPVKFNTFQRYR